MKQHLQDQRDDAEMDWTRLPEGTVAKLQEDPNPPLYCCQVRACVWKRNMFPIPPPGLNGLTTTAYVCMTPPSVQ